MSCRVSICIPAYNQTVFLQKTLDSVCVQTFKDFEVVISDDSSDGFVEELVAQYAGKINIRYSRNKPALGSPANWNRCLDLATGDLIKILHHDDWFKSPNALSEFVNVFNDASVSFAFCVSEIVDVKNNSVSFNYPSAGYLKKLREEPRLLFCENRIGAPTATMFRKTDLRFDERVKYVVDVDFYIRLLLQNQSFYFIDKPLIVNTSNHPGQVTTASLNKQTQVGEYAYLYNKLYGSRIPDNSERDLFISLFRKYKIHGMKEIQSLAGSSLKPQWYFKWLLIRSRI